MGNNFFNEYPYTDFHELNLSWVIKELRTFATTLEQFVSINALKYADPIQWNITTQYEKNTIVIDGQSGTAYISVQPVPAGVALTNTDYWTVVFDLEQFVTKANNNFTLRVEEATTLNATFPTNKGQWVIWGGILYEALSNIIAGDQYVEDSNIKRITIESVTGDLIDLDTDNTDNLVSAINEVLSKLTTEVTDRQNADTALQTAIDGVADNLTQETENRITQGNNLQTSINTEVTDRQNADTALQTSIDGVANNLTQETENRITQGNNLQSSINTEVTDRQSADTALQASIDSVAAQIAGARDKKVVIIADSYGMVHNTTFLSILKSYAPNIYDGVGVSSIGFLPISPYTFQDQFDIFIANYTQDQKNAVTDVVLCGGWNDAREIYQGGKTGPLLNAAILSTASHIKTVCPNAVVHPCFMAWHSARSQQNQVNLEALITTMHEYEGVISYRVSSLTDCKYPMRNCFCMDSSYFHPNESNGAPAIAKCLHENLFSGSAHYSVSYNFSYAYCDPNPFNPAGFSMRVSINDNVTKIVCPPLALNDASGIEGGIIGVISAPYMPVVFPSASGAIGEGSYIMLKVFVKGTINGIFYEYYASTIMYWYSSGNLLLLTPKGELVTSMTNAYIIINSTIDNESVL